MTKFKNNRSNVKYLSTADSCSVNISDTNSITAKLAIIDQLDILGKKRSDQIVETANRIVRQISKSKDICNIIEIIDDYSSEAIITIDKFGNIEAINKIVISMFGYTLHELKTVNIKDILPKFEFHSTESRYTELCALKRNTDEFFVEVNVNEIDSNKYVLLIKDISYNKELLDRNNTLGNILESLMHNNPNPVYHKNINLNYIGCNKAFEKLTGYDCNFIFNSKVKDIFPNNISILSDNKDFELINNLEKTNHQIYSCKLYNHALNRDIDVIVYNSAILDKNNKFAGIIGTIIDLTDYVNAKKSARLFETVLNESNEPVFILNNSGEVTFCNNAFLDILGYNRASFFKLTPPQFIEFTNNENEIILFDKNNIAMNKKVRTVKISSENSYNTLFLFNGK